MNAALPDNILRHMSKSDRAKLGKAGRTATEVLERGVVKAERDLQTQIEAWLRLKGYAYFRQRMDKRSTAKVGTPDFLICVRGRFIAVECKVGKGQPTEAQSRELTRVYMNEGYATVAKSLQDVITLCRLAEDAADTAAQNARKGAK